MNRSIEFRVWHKPTMQMHYVHSILFVQGIIFPLPSDRSDLIGNPLKLKDCELMQFTGILDRKGVKIWEGDILCYHGEDYMPVIYAAGSFGIPDKPVYPFAEEYSVQDGKELHAEVYGNIYQHAHLLELDYTPQEV